MPQDSSKQINIKRDYISQRAREISPSGIRKFFDLLASMDGAISLGVGEPDFVTPWPIREAGIFALEKGFTMYTSNRGILELREALSRYHQRFYNVNYDPHSEILITTGSSEALDLAFRATIDPGDEVIITDPHYVAYPVCISLPGGIPVTVPTYEINDFKILPAEIQKKITPKTKAILLSFPCNPTGAVMPRELLVEIAELAVKHDLLIVSDEIYARLTYDTEHTCLASLPGMKDRVILIGGFSKAFAMTGWRVGFVAANPEITEAILKVHQYTMMCAPIMAQMAAVEALKETNNQEVEDMLTEYDRRRRFIVKGFRDMGLSCFEPRGAFYSCPCIKLTGLTSEEFADRLLKEEKVAVVPGSVFGKCGEGYIRCCYATSMPEIEEALKRMRRFLSSLK
ncbi:MAG: aminotransferase class I/II-fold pyridoxal phosphate-dependent enzyme [Chloroflexi bacterium]|nr:aminotransferase class I/II-fold pyridoxal phosphate-dependent enzyme [Chloroflexota bacterium]